MTSAPRSVAIGDRQVGEDRPCFFIAEAGVNHNGDLELARRLIDVAAESGADAVKFQTFSADRLVSRDAPKAAYQKVTTAADESQHAMLARLELKPDDHRVLIKHCRKRDIMFLSSPFDEPAIDLLASLDVPAFKVPSGEIINFAYLDHMARKGRPILLSTGMSDLDEVTAAVERIRAAGNERIVLLHCLSNYPADPAEANLRAMRTMAESCGVPVGFSDHTEGTAVSVAAVALGACTIEKHFTLDRALPGPDHRASLEPQELADLIRDIRRAQSALGDGCKRAQPSEEENRVVIRKSLATSRDLPAGHVFQNADLTAMRPGTGLPPSRAEEVIGRRLKSAAPAGTIIALDMLAG